MAFKSSYQRLNKVLLERRVYDQGLATTKFETELTNLEDAFKKRGPNAEFFDTEEFWLLFHNLGVVNSRLADTHRVQLKELLLKRFDQKVLDDIGGMAIKSTDPLMHGFGKAVISKEKRESIDVEAARIRATEET
uniref:Uncharacterized protein n=1 Tax=Peronospora matthiolae TaxID=2874970 RepID=A0AAV1UUZ9_9STRA